MAMIVPMASSISSLKFCSTSTAHSGISYRGVSSLHLASVVRHQQLFASKLFKEESRSRPINAAGIVAQATTATEEDVLEWVKTDKRRMLHVVCHVGDIDRTLRFYTHCLGMKVLRRRNFPEERYMNVYIGYGPQLSAFVIKLTYNYAIEEYDIGTSFGHFGIEVMDMAPTIRRVKAMRGKVIREPGPGKGGNTVTASVEDHDGYKFEILEKAPRRVPLHQLMLRVGDLDRSIEFYEKVCGMELLRKRDNPEDKHTIAFLGYGPEETNAVLELTYNYGVSEYEKGDGYIELAIGTNCVYRTAEAIKLCGGEIIIEPGRLPGVGSKITACLDPDGRKTVFVDNFDFHHEVDIFYVQKKNNSSKAEA